MRYEIRPLGLGEILDQAVELCKNHFWFFVGIACILNIPLGLLWQFTAASTVPDLSPDPTEDEIRAVILVFLSNLRFVLMLMAVYFVGATITYAAVIQAVSAKYLQRSITIADAFKRALGVLWRMLVTTGLSLFFIVLGLLFFVFPGLYLLVKYTLVGEAVVIEGYCGPRALKRSGILMKGNYLTACALWFIMLMVSAAMFWVVAFLPDEGLGIAATIMNEVVTGVYSVFAAAVYVVFYFSARSKAEHFDLAILARSISMDDRTDVS